MGLISTYCLWKASTTNANGTYFSGVCYRFPESVSTSISSSYDCAVAYSTRFRWGVGSLRLTPDGGGGAYNSGVDLDFGSTYYIDISDFDNLVITVLADTDAGSYQVQLEDNQSGGTYWVNATFTFPRKQGYYGSTQGAYNNWNVNIIGSEQNFGDSANDTYWGETNAFDENYLRKIRLLPSYNGGSMYFEQIVFVKRASSYSHEFTHHPSVIGGKPHVPIIKDRVPGRHGYKFQYPTNLGRTWEISGDIISDATYYRDKFLRMYLSQNTFLFIGPDVCSPVKIEEFDYDEQAGYGPELLKYSMSLQEVIGKD